MKIPKIFLPAVDLEKKIRQFLKKNYTSQKEYENLVEEKKRKILVYFQEAVNLPPDGIYVRIKNPKDKENFFLEIYSTSEFSFPVCENLIDWGSRRRKEATAYLKTEDSLIHYFKLLQEDNNAALRWENNYPISEFKKRFYEEYKNENP